MGFKKINHTIIWFSSFPVWCLSWTVCPLCPLRCRWLSFHTVRHSFIKVSRDTRLLPDLENDFISIFPYSSEMFINIGLDMETTGDWTRPQCLPGSLAGSVILDGSQPGRHSVKQVRPWGWASGQDWNVGGSVSTGSPSWKTSKSPEARLPKKERRRQQRAPFKRCCQISTSAPVSRGDLWPQGSGLSRDLLGGSREMGV